MARSDRRSTQRLKLAKPLLATMDSHRALILDIGIGGAFVEHHGPAVPGLRVRLAFRWQGTEIGFSSEVVRSKIIREKDDEGIVSHSALVFLGGEEGSEERLMEMMNVFVSQLVQAQRANASADPGPSAGILGQLGQARRSRSAGLVTYSWDGIDWTRKSTDSPQQPLNGFTVAGYEDEEELATLCQAYEASDEEGRNLIRLMAELSVRSVSSQT